MSSVLGTILDPAADKTLMTTLTLTLAYKGMIPGECCSPVFMMQLTERCQSRLRSSYSGGTSSLAFPHFTFAIPPYRHL